MKKLTLIVIDDHALVREMFMQLFQLHENITVLGGCSELNAGIEMVKNNRPDIVLLDINLQNDSGFDGIKLIGKYSPMTNVIGVSMHTNPAYAKKMIKLGAKGYVTKNSTRQEMFKAISEVGEGRVYLCSEIKDNITDQIFGTRPEVADINALSLREIEIVERIKTGMSSKEIATMLGISVKTVEVHRYNILKKLDQKNAAGLINFVNKHNRGNLAYA